MRYLDPVAVVELVHDSRASYRNRHPGGVSTGWTIRYTTAVPMTTRHQTQRYRVYRPAAGEQRPFIVVRGERFHLTEDLAQKVTVS